MSEPAATLPVVHRGRRPASLAWSVFAAVVALPVAGVSLFRAVPAEWPLPVIQLLSFTPWLAVPAGLALVLALAGRRTWVVMTTAVLLAAQLFWLFPFDMGRPVPPQAGAPAPVSLTVMTINSEFGQADAGAIAQLVRDKHVDVLTVQEHTQALEDRLDAARLREVLPHLLSSPTDDASGSAVYSRFPLEAVGRLPDTPFQMPVVRVTAVSGEATAVVTMTSVHTLPPVDERIGQWRSDLMALSRQASRPGRQVLLGDFNATYDHLEFRQFLDGPLQEKGADGSRLVDIGMASGGRFAPTWPMENLALPGIVIDHVVTSSEIRHSGYSVHRVPGTDHAAVLAALEVPAS